MLSSAIFLLLAGCAPQPAKITFDGEPTTTVHALDALPVQNASVLAEDGKAIEPMPTLTWTVGPDSVAKLEGTQIIPVGNGEAKIEAKVGAVTGSYTLVVALPDSVEIAGYTAGSPLQLGSTATLTAAVKAGGTVVPNQTIAWTTSDAAVATIDDQGLLTPVAVGKADITATSGALSSMVSIEVGAPVASDAPVQ